MKINDVEKQLGIPKANIRFYEKEGLLTPSRSANGYRDYTEADIERLKNIVILRKLGIPVQQVADILKGIQPMQEALEEHVDILREEIQKLNGSLALCLQLRQEEAQSLDTERYWKIIHEKEAQGFQFQTLVYDYIQFLRPVVQDLQPWDAPERAWKNPFRFLEYLIISSGLLAAIGAFINALTLDLPFFSGYVESFLFKILLFLSLILLGGVLTFAVFLFSRKHPKRMGKVKGYTSLFLVFTVLLLALAGMQVLIYSDWSVSIQAVP